MFSISSSSCCCVRLEVPFRLVSMMSHSASRLAQRARTLKARCSRKCAVPFVSAVSAREPASIHMPTVEVWAYGECWVAMVRPFLRVVVCVLIGADTGVAKVRRKGAEGNALRVRPLDRLRASLREAIVMDRVEDVPIAWRTGETGQKKVNSSGLT